MRSPHWRWACRPDRSSPSAPATSCPCRRRACRAHGGIVEITADDLAMNTHEALSLLGGAEVELGDDDLHELVHQTEGWPVGLYLAALAVKAGGRTARSV